MTESLRLRIESAAHRILGIPPDLWRVKAEAYAIRHELRRMFQMQADIRAQYLEAKKRDMSFYYDTQWAPAFTAPSSGSAPEW